MFAFAKIGTLIFAPFLMAASFFGATGNVNMMASTTPSTWFTASTTATTTPGLHLGWWNGHFPKPHATSTPATTTDATKTISLSPTSGAAGTSVTITGHNFTSSSTVLFGPGAIHTATTSADGTQLTFTVPESIGPDCQAGHPCPMWAAMLTHGTYNVRVRTGDVITKEVKFTVTSNPLITGTTTPTHADFDHKTDVKVHATVGDKENDQDTDEKDAKMATNMHSFFNLHIK